MMTARELLDIAADYAEARSGLALTAGFAGEPAVDLDELAARFEAGLRELTGS